MGLDDISALGVLGAFPEPMLVIEPAGTLVFANPAARALLAEAADPVGRSILAYLPEQERNRLDPLTWMQRWAEVPDAPELRHVHLLLRRATGEEIPVRVRVGRLRTGAESFYVVMLQDISAEQQRQQQTRQAHRLAARVLAISADAIVNADEAFSITYANPSAERLFGYKSGALVGLPLETLLPQRFRADHAGHMTRFAHEPRAARLMGERSEIVGVSSTGEEIPLEASITKVTLDRALVFSAHLRDLRPRKAQERALAETLASLHTVFEHALQAMALLDRDGVVLQINAAARRLLPPDTDAVGEPFGTLPFWSDDPSAMRERLATAIETCVTGSVFRIPATIRFPGGRLEHLDFSLSPVMHEGAVFAMIAEARDLLAPAGGAGA